MGRRTAKLIRFTAAVTKTNYRALKKAFYNLKQRDKHRARFEMEQALDKQNQKFKKLLGEKNETEKSEI